MQGKMRGRVAAVSLLCAVVVVAVVCGAEAGEAVRGIYLGADECTEEMVSTLARAGFDTLFVTNNTYDLAPLRPAVAAAERHGLRVFWAMFFHGGPEIARGFEGNERRFVRKDGTVTARTTCPLDEVYWRRAAGERALMLAQWARADTGVAGIAFDIEMYAGASDYDWDQFCVCDHCWRRFAEGVPNAPGPTMIKASDRWAWLEKERLSDEYEGLQRREVRRIVEGIAREARRIAPQFQFAILPYATVFADDILAGFGTKESPCLAMREDTYSAGYRTDVEADALRLAREGVHAKMLVGCWAHKRAPMEWASHAYLGATRTGGYWMYEEFPWKDVFLKSDEAEREKHRLRGTPEEWREALGLANREIGRVLENPTCRPALAAVRLHRADYAMDLAGLPLAGPTLVKPQARSWQEVGMHWVGEYLELWTQRPGDEVSFVLPHRYGGPHRVKVLLAGGPHRGIVQVLIDGKEVGKPVDCYAPQMMPAVFAAEGLVALEATQHVLTLRVVGKSEASSGYSIGAECAYLEYEGPFCRDFHVIGPFDNAGHRGFDAEYPPERKVDLRAVYEGAGGQRVSWRRVRTDESGFVNLHEMSKPNEWVCGYAVTHLWSEEARVARLLLGSDDGAKVWVNGRLVWSAIEVRGPDADKDRFEVNLRKGWNEILVKVEQGIGGWGMHLRATDDGPKPGAKWAAR